MTDSKGKLTDLIGQLQGPPLIFEKFTDLRTAPDVEPWSSIKTFYNTPGGGYTAMGIIMNGTVTNQKKAFLMSYRIFNHWLEMHGLSEVSGQTYKKIMAQINRPELNFLRCIARSSEVRSNEKRAGMYEVIYPPLLEFINKSVAAPVAPSVAKSVT